MNASRKGVEVTVGVGVGDKVVVDEGVRVREAVGVGDGEGVEVTVDEAVGVGVSVRGWKGVSVYVSVTISEGKLPGSLMTFPRFNRIYIIQLKTPRITPIIIKKISRFINARGFPSSDPVR